RFVSPASDRCIRSRRPDGRPPRRCHTTAGSDRRHSDEGWKTSGSSVSSVQITQLMPQFHHSAMHVRLYSADIQIEKRPDLFQAKVVVMPQRKGCPLAR